MRLAVFLAAANEWARALALPLLALAGSAVLLLVAWWAGIDRMWPVAILGALALGLAIGWTGLVATTHTRRQHVKRHRSDGEGEPL